jgi:thioredoxin-like negative regulator of GroEL
MIVSEKNVSTALKYLADDPHPIAKARHDLTNCDNTAKRLFAEAFLEAEGSVEARKATAETSSSYQMARADEADAELELERHKARVKAAEMLIEVWRSENANIRAAEKIR